MIEELLIEYAKTAKTPLIQTIIQEILNLKLRNETVTKRDLYYKYKQLLKTVQKLDLILNEICRDLGLERIDLNVIATLKGLVSGNLIIITTQGKILDASQSPILIPNRQSIKQLVTRATKFLLVEKDAVFQSLVDKSFSTQFPDCLLITGKGYPDVVTRELVVALSSIPLATVDQQVPSDFWSDTNSLNSFFSDTSQNLWSNPLLQISLHSSTSTHIQGYCLTDCDPHGYEIYKTFKTGSCTLSHLNHILACSSLIWIGLKTSQLSPHHLSLPLSLKDRVKLVKMVKETGERELERMLAGGYKCEIEVFGSEMLMEAFEG
jgi:meiotic recombination protein SPO11